MHLVLTVLSAFAGLSSVQTQPDTCSYGNPYYGPYSIFNTRYSEIRKPRGKCTSVKNVNLPLSEFAARGPAIFWSLNDRPSNKQLDHACTTYFPLPDDPHTYFLYDTFVYLDGSSRVTTTIATDINVGSILRGNGYFTVIQNTFAFLDGNTIIGCEQVDFGDSTGHDVYVGTFGVPNKKLLGKIRQIIDSYNLAPDGLVVLPFKYPPRCVTQQVCSLMNPLFDPSDRNVYSPDLFFQ